MHKEKLALCLRTGVGNKDIKFLLFLYSIDHHRLEVITCNTKSAQSRTLLLLPLSSSYSASCPIYCQLPNFLGCTSYWKKSVIELTANFLFHMFFQCRYLLPDHLFEEKSVLDAVLFDQVDI